MDAGAATFAACPAPGKLGAASRHPTGKSHATHFGMTSSAELTRQRHPWPSRACIICGSSAIPPVGARRLHRSVELAAKTYDAGHTNDNAQSVRAFSPPVFA